MTEKRHGRWRFFYEARMAREQYADYSLRWWIPEEEERVYRMIECRHSGYGRTMMHSNATAVIRCANRYIRLHGVRRVTAQDWNNLCNLIAERAGFTHHATIRAFSHCQSEVRPSSVVTPHAIYGKRAEYVPPQPIATIEALMARMAVWRQLRAVRNMSHSRQRVRLYVMLREAKQELRKINESINSAKRALQARSV